MTCHELNLDGNRKKKTKQHQTQGLIGRTIVVHVRYTSLYIFLSSFGQQREMAKFCEFLRKQMTVAYFENVLASQKLTT